MQSSQPVPGLMEREVSEIISYVRIAELHGTHLSLTEVLKLTSSEMSEDELAEAWQGLGDLSSEYPLYSGRIVSKRTLADMGPASIEAKLEEGRRRVAANMETARSVWRVFAGDGLKMFAVSGGNSYDFARSNDDIDVFCVTKTGGLWAFVLKHLLVSRFYETFRKDIPRLCFSYALDDENARRAFSEPKDRLFARDALNLKVIEGQGFFVSLINHARWMKRLYPKAYAEAAGASEQPVSVRDTATGRRLMNLFLFRTFGFYIRMKSVLDNAKNRKMGRFKFVNDLRVGEGYLLFESRKYKNLRDIYSRDLGWQNPKSTQLNSDRN